MDSRFFMGSMSAAVGEKLTLAIEYAAKNRLPLIIFSASGGARMQEGILSLMQMAKTCAALARVFPKGAALYLRFDGSHHRRRDGQLCLPGGHRSGGAEALASDLPAPGSLQQTIGQTLPEGFQSAEFQMEHGFVDAVVPRSQMRETLAQLLRLHGKGEAHE